jgi:hypothetical protein
MKIIPTLLERLGNINRVLFNKNWTIPIILYIAGVGKPLELSPKELKKPNTLFT